MFDMVKSTYQPSAAAAAAAALPTGWTEHKAPSGHTYYYHAESKTSTYSRPMSESVAAVESERLARDSTWRASPYANAPSLADPNVANAYMTQFSQQAQPQCRGSHAVRGRGDAGRGGSSSRDGGRPEPGPLDKPRKMEAIPGCKPWVLVYTKYSRRFVHNPVKNASYWRIPEKLIPGILELDKERVRTKAVGDRADDEAGRVSREAAGNAPAAAEKPSDAAQDTSSEYEEVEVTEDEEEHHSKRQRTEEPADAGSVEFTEADIAAQLRAMGEDYALDAGEYDDGIPGHLPEGAEGLEFSEQDAKLLFRDLLDDLGVNPYSPWEKLLEDGKMAEDPRYTALATTKARRECWDEWSRDKLAELKEQRARQERKDPRVAYMMFLQEKATPKLYWPEFKRKYKKMDSMKDLHLSDKDREKAYREHIVRLKLPQTQLKSDLTALLKAQPLHLLNNKSLANRLPSQVLVDARYISLDPTVRDPLVEAFVQTLPPPPDDAPDILEDVEKKKSRAARARRERALEERDRAVEEQQRKRDRELAASKARLRDEERELDMAARIGNRGLQSQLASMQQQ